MASLLEFSLSNHDGCFNLEVLIIKITSFPFIFHSGWGIWLISHVVVVLDMINNRFSTLISI